MIQLSPGLIANLLGQHGLARMLEYGVIDLYGGVAPAQAQDAPTCPLLGRITVGGLPFTEGSTTNGLTLNRSDPVALQDTGDWVLTGVRCGEATWWRWRWSLADPNTADPYYPRMDGLVGESLFLPSAMIRADEQVPINRFYLTLGACGG